MGRERGAERKEAWAGRKWEMGVGWNARSWSTKRWSLQRTGRTLYHINRNKPDGEIGAYRKY